MSGTRVERVIFLKCYARELSQWKFLTDNERAAAMLLGWDCQIWNDGTCPAKGMLLWRSLCRAEKTAAVSLGYYEDLWDTEARNELVN